MSVVRRVALPVSDVTAKMQQMLRCVSMIPADLRPGIREQASKMPWTMRDADLIVHAIDLYAVRS